MPHPAHIAGIRKDYMLSALDESVAGDDPIAFFSKWFADAEASEITDVNAMTLATVSADGCPHARIVLLKGLEDAGFIFFTNYESDKGAEMDANPSVALAFYWKELERQVRIEGVVHKIPATDSDAYFHSRPEGSRIGAWASPQSKQIADRNAIELRYEQYKKEFSHIEIPRPPHWGGYRVVPRRIEFWQGRSSRMHDRILFQPGHNGVWTKSRLAP